jgi:signal transduction histidine kinase
LIRRILHDLGALRDPKTLLLGVVSGYAVTACFAVLVAIAVETGALPWHWMFGALLAGKACTNTLALIGLRTDRFALELGGINVAMDAVVMTGAIWATGDTASPLVAIYTIEVTVLAMLTNLTCTVLIGAFALVLYVAMGLLVVSGTIPRFPLPVEWSGRSATYLTTAYAFTAFVIGAPTFYVAGILRRLKDKESRLEAKTVALIEAGKQKAQFMANITHELRTPLQGIMGLSDLVAKGIYGEANDRQRKAMSDLKGSAKRLLTLIDDLLDLASHDAGKLEVRLAEVDVAELLAASAATAPWLLAGKQLAVAVDIEPALPTIYSDRARLSQVVLNLLSNAIKFTPDGGSITVRARRDDDGIVVEVDDTGIGIATDELDRVFDEFHQVDGSIAREYGGVGLGLALARRLVEMLGGTIAVRSELGRGSTFTVRLPREAPGTEQAQRTLRAV